MVSTAVQLGAVQISHDQPRGVGGSQMIIFDHKEGEGGLANDHRIMLMDITEYFKRYENIIRIYTL